jgi:hypothetical protein
MTEGESGLDLRQGFERSGMTYDELWVRQLELGGSAGRLELEAYMLGLLVADSYQHNVLAQALNECFLDRGEDHPVRYSDPIKKE